MLYQDVPLRKRVEGRYRIEAGGRVGFEVGAYHVSRTLVIDPVILYATNVGRAGSESGFRMAVDRSG
ncbi:MAG: hypothetical protein SFV51_06690, partial [Bryobacteraceae bacterium]|nr:hypothetical protein [Bryobacteraceae bacterium]